MKLALLFHNNIFFKYLSTFLTDLHFFSNAPKLFLECLFFCAIEWPDYMARDLLSILVENLFWNSNIVSLLYVAGFVNYLQINELFISCWQIKMKYWLVDNFGMYNMLRLTMAAPEDTLSGYGYLAWYWIVQVSDQTVYLSYSRLYCNRCNGQ